MDGESPLWMLLRAALCYSASAAAFTKFEGTQVRFATLLVCCNKLDVQHETPSVSSQLFYKLTSSSCCTAHCWILEEKTDIALGLYFVSPDGRGGHPLMVCQNTKEHLCSIVPRPIRRQGYDTVQMILGILGYHQWVFSSHSPVAGI